MNYFVRQQTQGEVCSAVPRDARLFGLLIKNGKEGENCPEDHCKRWGGKICRGQSF